MCTEREERKCLHAVPSSLLVRMSGSLSFHAFITARALTLSLQFDEAVHEAQSPSGYPPDIAHWSSLGRGTSPVSFRLKVL